MSRLYDYEKQEWVDVKDEDTTQLVAQGTHGFEKGVTVPVFDRNTGETYFIPSENTHAAFNDGLSFGSQELFSAAREAESQDIVRKHYDDAGNAMVAGALRGMTLGGSDVLMKQMLTEEQAQGLQLYKEENPMASISGEIIGAALPAVFSGGASLPGTAGGLVSRGLGKYTAGGVGAKIFSKTAEATAGRLGVHLSPKAASILSKTAGAAAEGAFFGVGEGISEAALGEPRDVVETLATVGEGAFLGSLFGGAAGGVFGLGGMALQSMKKTARTLGEKAGRMEIGKEFAAGRIKNTPNVDPETRKVLGEIAEDYADNPQVIDEYMRGGAKAAKEAAKELKRLDTETRKLRNKTWTKLKEEAKRWPKEQRKLMKEAVEKEGGNIHVAMERMYREASEDFNAMKISLAEMGGEPKIHQKLTTELNGFKNEIDRFNKGSEGQKQFHNVNRFLDDFEVAVMKADPATSGTPITEGNELLYALGMRKYLDDTINNGGGAVGLLYGRLVNLRGTVDNIIQKHPNKEIAKAIKEVDGRYAASLALSEHLKKTFISKPKGPFNTKYILNKKMTPEQRVAKQAQYGIAIKTGEGLLRAMVEPQNAKTLNLLLSSASDFGVEMDRLAKPIRSFQEKEAIRQQIAAKIEKVFGKGADYNLDAATDVLQDLAESGAHKHLDNLKNYEEALLKSQEAVSNVDKYVLLKQAIGEDISEDMLRLQRQQAPFERLKKVQDISPEGSKIGKLASSIAGMKAGGVLSGVGPMAAVGTLAGGLPGGIAGAAMDVGKTFRRDPMRRLQTIANIHKGVNKGTKVISDMVEKTSAAALGAGKYADRPARLGVTFLTGDSLTKKREKVQKVADTLATVSIEPVELINKMEPYIAPFDDTPKIQGAMSDHAINVALYLERVMPGSFKPGNYMFERKPEPSDADVTDFARYIESAFNPLSVLDKVARGTVAQQEINTLRDLYPSIYRRLQEQVINDITEKGPNIPYSRRLMLGTVLQIPTDASLQGQFVADMQQKYAVDQGGRPQGSPEMRGKLDSQPEQSTMTLADQIENRGVANP